MSCTDRRIRAGALGVVLLAGCSSPVQRSTAVGPADATGTTSSTAAAASPVGLPPPATMRSWADVRLQAAQRLVAANPHGTFIGRVPEPLLGIPVLEIELNGDGSVRRIVVLRHPQEASETTQLAEDAVRRAAPFGDVSHLPKPWRFTETFLFDRDHRFKPRTLD